jgi:hypothetical protein
VKGSIECDSKAKDTEAEDDSELRDITNHLEDNEDEDTKRFDE